MHSHQPSLKPLHADCSLIDSKLDKYGNLSDQELIDSLKPGQQGSLKVRPDGTIVDGRHEWSASQTESPVFSAGSVSIACPSRCNQRRTVVQCGTLALTPKHSKTTCSTRETARSPTPASLDCSNRLSHGEECAPFQRPVRGLTVL